MNKDQEAFIRGIVVDDEYTMSKNNQDGKFKDFEATIDMLECKRNEKEYDWMSDNFLPEFPSIVLTDASDWANQYFTTRSFVEVKLEGDNPLDKPKCAAAKKLINKVLNNRAMYHFHKYIRARMINTSIGEVYLLCRWEQEFRDKFLGYEEVPSTSMDMYGNPLVAPNIQVPAMEQKEKYESELVRDMFNYDVLDPRNVFPSSEYAYSAQEKEFIIVRSEKTWFQLKADEAKNGYIGIDKLRKYTSQPEQTDTSRDTEDDEEPDLEQVNPKFDVIERFGKFWVTIKASDENGYPTKIEPGYDKDGNVKSGADFIECIITFAQRGGESWLIRFQPTPFVDSKGKPYRPLVRGICYVHPTKDTGLNDGLLGRELQVAINDTFNISNDRIKLATMPTLKVKKYSNLDNPTIYFEPQHAIEVEDTKDIEEFQISDNIQGALQQIQMLKGYMQQATAKYPTTMGDVPTLASTTATAVSEAGGKSSLRTNYKSLTVEYTMLTEFYWMIMQMAWQFANPETAQKMLGDLMMAFDPDADYTFTPVSSAIETEFGKFKKLSIIDQFLGRIANIPNPNTPKVLNYLLGKAFELFSDEFPDYKNFLLDESVPPPMEEGQMSPQMSQPNVMPTSNQNGLPMSLPEEGVRGM